MSSTILPVVGNPPSYVAWVNAGSPLRASHPLSKRNRGIWARLALGLVSITKMTRAELVTTAIVGRTLPAHASTTAWLRDISRVLTSKS